MQPEAPLQPHASEAVLPVLQELNRSEGYLRPQALHGVSTALRLSQAQTYGVATFYSMLSTRPRGESVIRVCDGPVCALHECPRVRAALEEAARGTSCTVERTSCLGLCDRAPAALVNDEPCGPIAPEFAGQIVSQGWRGSEPSYAEPRRGEVRVTMARIGRIDPEEIETAIQAGAYGALTAALSHDPAWIVDLVTQAGLQGCGGAGFPSGRKWQMVAQAQSKPKYVVCNADESEPAAFKDRVLLEGDPHLLIEGMALAAYAVGAEQGYIYIRGEYERAARRLERAIEQARQHGWLGHRIGGYDFSFDVHVHRGAGAYICGEETALLESLEGKRGEPRFRPPYPTTHGFRGCPTIVNNVETLCKVPAIIERGAPWHRSLGTASSPGTKVFAVSGHVRRPGVFEAPFGITLRKVIDDFAEGMREGSRFKMALTGGAAGTIVGPEALDVPLDFAAAKQGVALGAGAVLVMDDSVSVLKLLGWLLRFFEVESCGKCTPCRVGTRELRLLIEQWRRGSSPTDGLEQLRRYAAALRLSSLCGLGQSVAWPIESALRNFPQELQATTNVVESLPP